MKKSVIFLFCLSIGLLAFGQNQTKEIENTIPYFTGIKNLNATDNDSQHAIINKYLCKQVCYPAKSIKCNREGIEVIKFTVNPTGTVCNFEVINSVCPAIDEAMINALKNTSGMWKPAMQNGRAIASTTEVYRVFKIDDELTANEILEIFRAKATEYFKRGNKQLFVKNNPEKALKLYNKGYNFLPYDESLLMARGICNYELGNNESARNDWNRLKKITLRNQSEIDFKELAQAYCQLEGYSKMLQILMN